MSLKTIDFNLSRSDLTHFYEHTRFIFILSKILCSPIEGLEAVKMKKVIFPGSFDPPTLGHLDIIKRASKIFDYIYIGIGLNTLKQAPNFSVEDRKTLLKAITIEIPNVEIISFQGLLVDFAKKLEVCTILRSIRDFSDFEYENVQGQMNRKLENIETLYITADPQYRYISSSLIREIASHGRRLHAFIPKQIEDSVFKQLSKQQ